MKFAGVNITDEDHLKLTALAVKRGLTLEELIRQIYLTAIAEAEKEGLKAMKLLALPAPAKTIKVRRNKARRNKCHLNTHECSISQRLAAPTLLTIQACEDDSEDSFEKPMLDVEILHGCSQKYEGRIYPSRNLYMVKTDRYCTHQELVELAQALMKAMPYLPEDGTPA